MCTGAHALIQSLSLLIAVRVPGTDHCYNQSFNVMWQDSGPASLTVTNKALANNVHRPGINPSLEPHAL